jgi:hypothetical protein
MMMMMMIFFLGLVEECYFHAWYTGHCSDDEYCKFTNSNLSSLSADDVSTRDKIRFQVK